MQEEVQKLLKKAEEEQTVWLTILALYILSSNFKDKEEEWQLIAKKAKTYLKKQGIIKVDPILKKITIAFN